MTRLGHGTVFWGLVLVLALPAGSAFAVGPWPDPWQWNLGASPPVLTLLLGMPKFQKTLVLPATATEVDLILKKYVMTEDTVTMQWKAGGQPWLSKSKKIPGSQSSERVALPPPPWAPGFLVTLQVSSRSGQVLAEITLKK
jgi:hypothetical protein